MTAVAATSGYRLRRPGPLRRFLASRFLAVTVVILGILVIWYVAAWLLNAPFQRELDQDAGTTPEFREFVLETWEQDRPVLPSPHQVAIEVWSTTLGPVVAEIADDVNCRLDPATCDEDAAPLLDRIAAAVSSKRSLLYHAWVTLSSTLLGFVIGTLLGIGLAVVIVHIPSLDRSLMPWIVSSQTIPILAIAPMVIVVLAAIGMVGLLPKAIISTYLSFFPVTVGMVKGLRSPDPIHLDLMRTYNASRWQAFWKLRFPSSLPFLFVSMKIAVAAALVGAIVGELPTGSVAGIGARLLTGSYYGQTVQIWSALVAAAVMAGILIGLVGLANRIVLGRLGMRS